VNLGTRDKRALMLAGVALALIVILRLTVYGEHEAKVIAASDSIPVAEKRLARLRQIAATVPGKETVLKQVSGDLATRDKGIVMAQTAQQALAHVQETIRRLANAEGIQVRGGEFQPPRPLGDDYGEVSVAVSFECRIEQLVNVLAALTREPELLSTSELHVASANPKEKTVLVRLALAGVVPRKLVPEKKGVAAF
jgi:type II secretion system (T2SS) protein M